MTFKEITVQPGLYIYRDEHIMLLKFQLFFLFFLHLSFSKLFPEMKQLNMFNFLTEKYKGTVL